MKKKCYAIPTLLALLAMCGCQSPTPSTSGGSTPSGTPSTPSEPTPSIPDSPSVSVEDDPTILGDGTKESPYLVSNPTQLKLVLMSCMGEEMKFVSIENNITLRGEWEPIGDIDHPVNACILGNGYRINGLSITQGNELRNCYGLLGCFTGTAYDLEVEGNIDFAAQNASCIVGLFAGVADNSYLQGVSTFGTVRVRNNTEIEGLETYIGGVVGAATMDTYMATVYEELSFQGDIISSIPTGALGGLVGYIPVSYSVVPITNSSVDAGQIKGGHITGGVVGQTAYYSSVTNTVVKADSIEAIGKEGAYAGGIVGLAYYETAILSNVVQVDSVQAMASTSSMYKSYAGDVAGYVYQDGYESYSMTLGAALYHNYSMVATTLSADNKLENQAEALPEMSEAFLQENGFARAWNLVDGKAVLKPLDQISEDDVDVTIHKNDGTSEKGQKTFAPNSFQEIASTYTRDHYFNHGLYYDETAQVAYRFYAPLNGGLDLYTGWFESSRLTGYYRGSQTGNGEIQFLENGVLVWAMSDWYSCVGTWWCDGKHLIIDQEFYGLTVCQWEESSGSFELLDPNDESYSYLFSRIGNAQIYGYWESADGRRIFLQEDGAGTYYDGDTLANITYTRDGNTLNVESFANFSNCSIVMHDDGSLTFHVCQDDEYNFSWDFVPGTSVPNYQNKAMIGRYNGTFEGHVELLANGNFAYYKTSEDSAFCTGGFRISDRTVTMKCFSVSTFIGEFKYDATNKALVRADGKVMMVKEGNFQKSFHTSDNKMYVHVFDNRTYVVLNGAISRNEVVGTLEEGQTVMIGQDEYSVHNDVLTYISPEQDKSPLANTYIDEDKNIELVLNQDGTGTYDGNEITWTLENDVVNFEVNTCPVTLNWDAANKTLTGSINDGEYDIALSFIVKPEPVVELSLVGTWEGEGVFSNRYRIQINADGTYVLTVLSSSPTEFKSTWTGDVYSKITLDCTPMESAIFNACEISVVDENSVKVVWADWEDMPGDATWTKVA